MEREGRGFGILVSGSKTQGLLVQKQLARVQRPLVPEKPLAAEGPGPRAQAGSRALRFHSSGKICFQEEKMAQFYFPCS